MSASGPQPGNPLYPLANPKGVSLLCELCQKPAFIECKSCRVTFYCTVEHQHADWYGIHKKICEDLIELRSSMPFLSSENERKKRKSELQEKQEKMIEVTRTTGQKLLFEGRFEEAVPAALQSIKFVFNVYGTASVELVPSYLILGEASIGLNRIHQAEEYLSQAQWTVMKTTNPPQAIRSQLHRILGLLFTVKQDYDQALEHLAHDVYYASCQFGTDDIKTSGGYFYMANVFLSQGKIEIADDLYTRVTTIWYRHLRSLVDILATPPDIPEGMGEVVAEITQQQKQMLDEAQEAEAVKVLTTIYHIRNQEEGTDSKFLNDKKIRIRLALAYLNYVLRDEAQAHKFFMEADGLSNKVRETTLINDLKWMKESIIHLRPSA